MPAIVNPASAKSSLSFFAAAPYWSRLILENGWITPSPLLHKWQNYNDGNDGYNPVGYYKDALGIVHLRGLIKGGDEIGHSAGVFILNTGYRPTYRELFSTLSADTTARVDVTADGKVVAVFGDRRWLSLDGLTFRAKKV